MTQDLSILREIADGASVHPTAVIGPFCVVGPQAVIGPRTVLGRRVSVIGRTTVGADNVIDDDCVLGAVPQDLKYVGRKTYLFIGDRNRFGPRVTAHIGTEPGGYLTRIGHDNVLEAGAHVAHDCFVDDKAFLGPGVLLAGHIRVMRGAKVHEHSGVHHFTTIGPYSEVGARTPVRRDVPPFAFFTSHGYYTSPPAVTGLSEAGMAAAGLSAPDESALREAFARLFGSDHAQGPKLRQMLAQADLAKPVQLLCQFLLSSLEGTFGRYRETFRGQIPPEAREHFPPEILAEIEKAASK